jgi:hypothetical protein
MAQDSDEGKKGGSCFRQGCGLLLAVLVIGFFVTQCGPVLLDYFTEGEDTADRSTAPVVTSPPPPDETTPVVEDTIKLPEDIQRVQPPEEIVTLEYSWDYGGSEWNWEISIPRSAYEAYRSVPRSPTMDYSVYVTHPSDDAYIGSLVESIREAASSKGYSEYQIVEFATAFVQSLEYTEDSVTSPYDEYPRYPIETLFDKGGDCEDTSILLASLLHSMDYGVVLIELSHHCAVGILGGENIYGSYWEYEGRKYFYIETTNTGWGIGDLPDVYEKASAFIYPMVPIPVISHEWTLESKVFWDELTVAVNNLGTATARGVYVLAGYDAGNNQIWNSVQSDTHDLEAGMRLTTTLVLNPPPSGIHTRLLVQVVMGGYSVSESYSDWFDT